MEEQCETISLQQTGEKPNEKLVERFTRAYQNVTVKRIGMEMQVQMSTTTKETVMERGQPDTISRAQLNEIDDYNLTHRIVCEWDDIPPAMDEVKMTEDD